jgi:hypothetical protein
LRAGVLFLIIFFTLSNSAIAQLSPQTRSGIIERRLPPSLERELKLKRGGKVRIIGFIDTLKAQSLIAQSIRDSSLLELDSLSVKDSAIILIDSSVSLTDKEWLDSMLAELPEYQKTPEGIRFFYPADILVETNRKVVPSDTTLPSKMDPVTKEDLPLYGASPMPRPLQHLYLPRTSIELGAGSPYIPRIDIRSLVFDNKAMAIDIGGRYRLTNASEPAIKQYWNIGASGRFAFASDSLELGEQVPQLDVSAQTGANKRTVAGSQATLSNSNIEAGFIIGSPSQLKLQLNGTVSFLNDEAVDLSETDAGIGISLLKDISNSTFRLVFDSRFELASAMNRGNRFIYDDYIPDFSMLQYSPKLFEAKIVLQQKEDIQWKAGLTFIYGSDVRGITSLFIPVLGFKTHLSSALEIGAGFEPNNELINLKRLYSENLFFSLFTHSVNFLFIDPRSVVSEPIHIDLFANYFLSLNDELHIKFRYIERNHEPVFDRDQSDQLSTNDLFDTRRENTRYIELEAGGSLQAFPKDKLRASFLFRSAVNRESDAVLPFVPKIQLQANYQFGIWEKFIPEIEFVGLARPDHSFTFLNFEAKYIFTPNFVLKLRAENILGSAGDFWTGYNEYPRSVWLSGMYNF